LRREDNAAHILVVALLALYGHLFDETVRESPLEGRAGRGLLPYLRALLGQETLDATLVGETTIGGLIDPLLNGHASLYVGLVFVLFVPDGLPGTLRARLGGTFAEALPQKLRGDSE
jgi:branched-chain amino acid transport system permease protein